MTSAEDASTKHQALLEDDNPLRKSSVLQLVFESVGPGHGLFLKSVNSEWRALYQSVGEVNVPSIDTWGLRRKVKATAQMTLISSTFESASRLRLAQAAGLSFDVSKRHTQQLAGRHAVLEVLAVLHEQGLSFNAEPLWKGAAERGRLPVLDWLLAVQHCTLPKDICTYAVASGSIDVLTWLRQRGAEFSEGTRSYTSGPLSGGTFSL
jgi:hypothetical protein